jgi:peptide/nickel transport system substrate-binding protein
VKHLRYLLMAAALVAIAIVAAACGSSGSSSSTSSGGGGSDTAAAGGDYLNGGFAAAETPVKGGTLKMAMNSNIDCWNGLSYYGISWSVFYFMARGLYGYPNTVVAPATDEMQPELASDMPSVSSDGKTYTVKLREGLTFPDGSPVTAKDVKATYEYMLDPNIQCATGGPPASGYYSGIVGESEYSDAMTKSKGKNNIGISGIKAVDDLTTSFTLVKPDGSFPRALAMGWAFIVPASTPHKKSDTPPPFVGPYKISDYQLDKSVTIEREPSWDKNVAAGVPQADNENNVDAIDLQIGVPDETQYAQLKNNEIDMTFDGSAPTGSEVPATANDPAYKSRFYSTPDAAVDYAVFKTDVAPFDNVMLRQAVNYALDRDAIVKVIGGKLSRSPWSQILSENLLADQPTDVYSMDVEKAKQLIKDSGVPTPINITLANFSDAPSPQVSAAMKEALEAVGFKVTVKALSADVYYGFLADPKSDYNIGVAAWGEDYADAITYYGPLLLCGQGSNYGQFCDKGFDAKVDEINQLPPGADRTAQFAQLSTDTATNLAPWATLDLRRKISFVSERLGNYVWGPGKQFYFASYFLKDGK